MECPKCQSLPDKLYVWWGHDGEIEGIFCQLCNTCWYSSSIDNKARRAINLALRTLIDTQPFPEDAVEAKREGDHDRYDPRRDQRGFDDYYRERNPADFDGEYSWIIPERGAEEAEGRETQEEVEEIAAPTTNGERRGES